MDRIVKFLAGIAGALAGFMGEWSALLTALAVLMVMDYATGVALAWRGRSPKSQTGGVSSEAGFDGLLKKAFIIMIVLLATILDHALGTGSMVFQTATVCYYIANEGLSILENAALMGVPVPGAVERALEVFRKKGDGEE